MALIQMNFFSTSLMRMTNVNIILPNDTPPEMKADNPCYERPIKTLYLLHGFTASCYDWMLGGLVQEMALKYHLAIVMPSGDNSFYVNAKGTGYAYETYTGAELPAYVQSTFGLSGAKEDNFIGGLSMGGFGALHTGLRYPKQFGRMFGLSSALIIHNIKGMRPGTVDEIADYDYYERTFGDLDNVESSENNPEYLVKIRQEKGETIQPVFMACGTEDFLLKENRIFRDFLREHKVNLTYMESPGMHDWKFWNEYLEPAVQWMLEEA